MTQQGPNKCMTDWSFNWLDMHILYLLLCNLRAKDSAGHKKQTDPALIYLYGRFGKNCKLTCCLSISGWHLHHVYITVSHMKMGQSVFPLICFSYRTGWCNDWISEIHLSPISPAHTAGSSHTQIVDRAAKCECKQASYEEEILGDSSASTCSYLDKQQWIQNRRGCR